jgi:hypothetical protein
MRFLVGTGGAGRSPVIRGVPAGVFGRRPPPIPWLNGKIGEFKKNYDRWKKSLTTREGQFMYLPYFEILKILNE